MAGPVLVIGGTAGTGALVVDRLHAGGVAVRALARRPERTTTLARPGIEVVRGDVTAPDSIAAAVAGARSIVYTAGLRSFLAESRHRAIVVDGVRATVAAAGRHGVPGRFVLMSSIGATRASLFGAALNVSKGHALEHKACAEAIVRESGLDYAIMRAGCLTDRGGPRPIVLGQENLPLTLALWISRADAAAVLVEAITAPRATQATFDAYWGGDGEPGRPSFAEIVPDQA